MLAAVEPYTGDAPRKRLTIAGDQAVPPHTFVTANTQTPPLNTRTGTVLHSSGMPPLQLASADVCGGRKYGDLPAHEASAAVCGGLE